MCADVRKMCKKFERSLAMGMHRIMQVSHLEMRILETMLFTDKHTTINGFDSLLNARIDCGVWRKRVEGKIPQSEEALSNDKIAYLATKPPLRHTGVDE